MSDSAVVVAVTDESEAPPVFAREMSSARDTPPSSPKKTPHKLAAAMVSSSEGPPPQQGGRRKGESGRQPVAKMVEVNVTKDPTSSGATEELMQRIADDPDVYIDDATLIKLIFEEFPAEVKTPTREDIDDAVLRAPATGLPYETGQWIERLGTDMIWHLEPIRRVVRIVRSEGAAEYFYKTSAGLLVDLNEARAPEEGIKRHFGMRPFAWQQWANLRIEDFVRFQRNHDRDFNEVSYLATARFLWDVWFKDPRNADFRELYFAKPPHTQERLVNFFMQPFRLMDIVLTDWDFSTTPVSVYQYASFLGSGFSLSILIMGVQLVIPFLILDYQVRTSDRFPNWAAAGLGSLEFTAIFATSWQQFCYKPTPVDQVLINFVVFVVYIIRIFPAVYLTFYQTVGDMDNVTSKLNSIRAISWFQGDDTMYMQVGFKMDRYMNSLYIAVINVIMLFVLFLTDSTLSVILNALALEFVYMFDKEVAKSEWYDDDFRYLKVCLLCRPQH